MYSRVLIVSEDGLPDIRVEKMMNTLARIAEEIHFIGEYRGFSGIELIKKPVIHNVTWSRRENLLIPPYYHFLARRVKKLVEEIKPELIIAVNLIAGSILDKYGYNFILDYHEAWSLLLEYIKPPSILRKVTYMLRKHRYPSLEEKLVTKYPFITFSNNAREYFREKYGIEKIYVVKNYPSILELKHVSYTELDCSKKYFVYIGRDLVFFDGQTYRDLRPTLSVLEELWRQRRDFKIKLIGYSGSPKPFIEGVGRVKHIEMYEHVIQTHYGILSYKPAKVQRIVNPNKPYIYGLAFSIPIVTSSLNEIVSDLGEYSILVDIDNYMDSLKKTYHDLLDMDCEEINKRRRTIHDYIVNNLLWEKQENIVLEAVKKH